MTISEELQEANEWVESTIKLMKMGKEAQKISDKKKMMETIDETFKKFKPKSIFIINFCNKLKNSVEENMKTHKQSNVKKNKSDGSDTAYLELQSTNGGGNKQEQEAKSVDNQHRIANPIILDDNELSILSYAEELKQKIKNKSEEKI